MRGAEGKGKATASPRGLNEGRFGDADLGTSFIIVTHDHDLAAKPQRVLHLDDGVLTR